MQTYPRYFIYPAYTRRLSSCSVVTCTYSPQSLTKSKLLGMSKLVA
ncbi:Uncharacterised protein [Serratia fonticola]|jgi:hypothetical protein|nr:Uncharacterised protein [Serratia fonticola]CAI2480626.1 Uncharacterised protein [Serratia fonticola]